MGENLSPVEQTENKKIYPSVAEYLSAFEESAQFNEALSQRKKELMFDRPDINLTEEELVEGTRLSFEYRKALIDFYQNGNKLPIDLSAYNEDAQEAIGQYWKFVKSMPYHISVMRATSKGLDDEEIKLFRMEKARDRLHTFAGLALLGEGVTLANGQKITCDEIDPQDESAMDLESYSILGRALVSIITEENGLDIADPNREEAKTAATLNFLEGSKYVSGHWVAKGER